MKTIAAISTPIGHGGIGIVRVSGDDALKIIEKVFVPNAQYEQHKGEYMPRALAAVNSTKWSNINDALLQQNNMANNGQYKLFNF